MVALTSWSYPLHSLISQEQLSSLIAFSCQHLSPPSSSKTPGSLEWGQRAVQCLLIDIIHHGEIKPYFESLNKPYLHGEAIHGEAIFEEKSSPTSSTLTKSPDEEKKEVEKVPTHDEQELKRMDKMFNKAPIELPQILLSCGEVEIPLNRRTWKGRKGMEELKKLAEKEKNKLQEEKEKIVKEEGSKQPVIPEETQEVKGEAKATDEGVVGEAKESSSVKGEATSPIQEEAKEKETKVVKTKDVHSVGGLKVSDLKRYLRLTYLQGDFEHMVDFPPPEKHSYGIAMHNPIPSSIIPHSYSSFIISNSFDYRVNSSLEISAELELQQLAKKVYESVLHSLLHARPTPDPTRETWSGEMSPVIMGKDDILLGGDEMAPFAVSTDLLTHSIEQLLTRALTPQSNLDLVSVMEFCNDINSLLPISSPLLPKPSSGYRYFDAPASIAASHGSTMKFKGVGKPWEHLYPFIVAPISSKMILSLVSDCLLKTQAPSSKMWLIGISLLRASIRYLWFFVHEMKTPVDIDYHQMLAVFVKLFSSRLEAIEMGDIKMNHLLIDLAHIKFVRKGENGDVILHGIYHHMELLTKLIEKRFVTMALVSFLGIILLP